MEKFMEKLNFISGKFAQNSVLNIISGAFMLLLPITMVGGIIALFNGISIESYQAFLVSSGAKSVLTIIYQWTLGMLGVYLAFVVAYQYVQVKQCSKSPVAVAMTSLVCFLIITPYGENGLPLQWLGSTGMFSAIVVSFIVGGIFSFCKRFNIAIKLPEQVPTMISSQFTALIPVAIAVILFGIVNLIFVNTSFGTFHQLIYAIIAKPLQSVGTNIFGYWILMVAIYGLWFCGIHGGMSVGPVMMMLFMQLQLENLAAYQAGSPLPHLLIGDAVSIGTGSLPLVVAVLLFCKSKSNRAIGKLGLFPSIFGVDEPMYFGMPMVLNPMFFIPWVILTPTITVFGSHFLKIMGLLSYCNGSGGQSAANLPFFVGNTMNYGIDGLIWGIVFFVIIVMVYLPFVKAYDKQMIIEESKHIESN